MITARELWKSIGQCGAVQPGEYCHACERRIAEIEERDKERDADWQARVDAATGNAEMAREDAARREGWQAGIRAIASAITDRGVYHPALEAATENLIAKGPPE